MSDEDKKQSCSSLPEEIRKLISTEKGRGIIKYFSEHPDDFQTAISASEVRESAAEIIKKDPEIQKTINSIKEKLLGDRKKAKALFDAQTAIRQAALSGTIGNFKKYADEVQGFQRNIGMATWDYSKHIAANAQDDDPVPLAAQNDAIKQEQIFNAIIEGITGVRLAVREFLDEFKEIATKNEKSSNKNASSSNKLSKTAIIITTIGIVAGGVVQAVFAYRAEINDKTGKLIEVVKKSHPGCEQQIGAEDAKNVSVAFHAVTQAMQENIQRKHEISQLQEELKKSQDRCKDTQRKFDELSADSIWEQQRLRREITSLQSEIAVLQKKIKVFEAVSEKRSGQPSASETKK